MENLKFWMYAQENDVKLADVPIHRLQIVLDEINGHIIGIRGADIFTIDYQFVSNVSQLFM